VLFDYPICQHCDRELATDVDHIRPIERGGDPWALSNLQALCAPCHGRKMKAELS
jgi:5-methylcytosine-specific restriction enzyme A